MQTTSVSLGDLIDRALYALESPVESGRPVMLGSNALENVSDTQFTLSAGSLQETDLVEFGSELMLVANKSADVTPIYTVSRGYYGTPKSAHAEGTVGRGNPQFPRRRVADAVDRSFTRLEALGVPLVSSETVNRDAGSQHVTLDADVRQVLQVLYINPSSGKVLELDGWQQYDTVPSAVSSTGKMLTVPWYVTDADDLTIVYHEPYRWVGGTFPDESVTVSLPKGAEDLPSSYAAAFLVEGREVSRQQLDAASDWAQSEPLRQGGGNALVRLKWQEFYRALDEARRVVAHEVPRHRPMIRRAKVRI